MNTSEITTTMESRHQQPKRGRAGKVASFILQLVQMVLAMVAEMMVYYRLLLPVLVPTGLSALNTKYPLIGLLDDGRFHGIGDARVDAPPPIHLALLWRNDGRDACSACRAHGAGTMFLAPNPNLVWGWLSLDGLGDGGL